jgi:plastocyanin domain-containing protein
MKSRFFSLVARTLLALVAVGSLVTLAACQKHAGLAKATEIHIDVTDRGFVATGGARRWRGPATLVFTRKTDQTCAKQVVIASLGVRRDLPLGTAVRIDVPSGHTGTLDYVCGMDMVRGQVTID